MMLQHKTLFLTSKKGTPEFNEHRHLGKMANFLKNYGGGMGALMDSLNVDRDMAKKIR